MEGVEASVAYTTCTKCGAEVPVGNATLHRVYCGEPEGKRCPRCTFVNGASECACEMCGQALEPAETDGWACPRCTFINPNENAECEMCEEGAHEGGETSRAESMPAGSNRFVQAAREAAAGAAAGAAAANAHEWRCEMCTFANPQGELLCQACAHPHEEESAGTARGWSRMDGRRSGIGYHEFYPPQRSGSSLFGSEEPLNIMGSIAGSLVGAAMGATLASFNDSPSSRNVLAGASLGAMAGAGLGTMASAMNHPDRTFSMDGFTSELDFIEEHIMNEVGENPAVGAADRHTISSLPTDTARGSNEEGSCVICMEPYRGGDPVKRLPCLHNFHARCVDEWLQRSGTCPVCKHAL